MLGDVRQLENWTPPRRSAGALIGEATFELPADLPLGYHRLHARTRRQQSACRADRHAVLARPAGPAGRAQAVGLATQLYSVRSRRSWGVGDLTDLADLAAWAGVEHDAGVRAGQPAARGRADAPMEPSPYLPTTRRFANPLYLRVERIPEYATSTRHARAGIDQPR